MTQRTLTGFVVIDGEQVLSYDDLRAINFIGPSAEAEYLGGAHGINGLFQIRATPKQTELMDNQGLSLALVQTPWFDDRRLAMEPETDLEFEVDEDHGELLDLAYYNGYTKVAMEADECGMPLKGKISVSMYSSNSPQPLVNLIADIGWNSAVPAMPSPADVLAQLGSQKSLEQQFAEAFAPAKPAPAPVAPQWTPPAPAPWATQPQMAPAPVESTPQPAPVPLVKAPPLSHSDLMKTMFPRF